MTTKENMAPTDRAAPVAWILAGMSVLAAWAAFSTFKSDSAELTVVVPLWAPAAVFVPVAVEIGRRFGGVPFAAVAFVQHRLGVRRWFGAACDLPIAVVVLLGVQIATVAIIVAALVLSLPRIG